MKFGFRGLLSLTTYRPMHFEAMYETFTTYRHHIVECRRPRYTGRMHVDTSHILWNMSQIHSNFYLPIRRYCPLTSWFMMSGVRRTIAVDAPSNLKISSYKYVTIYRGIKIEWNLQVLWIYLINFVPGSMFYNVWKYAWSECLASWNVRRVQKLAEIHLHKWQCVEMSFRRGRLQLAPDCAIPRADEIGTFHPYLEQFMQVCGATQLHMSPNVRKI